ncbi:Sec-independent protein translocase subunit TatA [Nocardiopsis sediminis]|uniref:Sec-independent protein translocase protein TatA n=1 Tax=Nocardiopsis sediminis TaxID=1778267 RepID=A0ABV8FJY9_9ACTN
MGFGPRELLILLLIALVLFGAKKLPDLARSIGRSARILKAETKGLSDEEQEAQNNQQQAQAQQQAPAPQAAPQPPYDPQAQYNAQQQPGYPELPAGQRIVNENGETVRRGPTA